jgi:hypothetical protein
MFQEGIYSPYVLELFLKLFPEKLDLLYENIEKKSSDMESMEVLVKNLAGIDSSLSLEALKKVFYFSSGIIKREVLNTMKGLSRKDTEFLFSVLKERDFLLKKEAMAILAKDAKTGKGAIEILLSVPNPWGRNNNILVENIMVIAEMGLKEASSSLLSLSKKGFLWNRAVRRKAREVLRGWHEGKD